MATGGSNRTRLYTRTGDRGETGLSGGGRVEKTSPRIAAFGTFDELGSFLGAAEAALPAGETDVRALLLRLQHQLYVAMSELATPPTAKPPAHRIGARHVTELEAAIDRYAGSIEPVHAFVLPRGTPAGAAIHVARTVARRAERALWELHEEAPQREELLQWANRLSDLLFAVALVVNRTAGFAEISPDYAV
ncbi:MAG TPA: cob(I)yrinic acid a,c-diamide adenosyltransferase [Thermoplasmata archaeon]|nr:cob(I)yrinic acid a,c-diamide adenosyltransferase [Thermoplasmata archaeon]